ncbi:sporulation histidine kinase inhibitor Sda [Cohnella sp. CFH 77786]|nr:sporulation histidine kinase inhibitor Sda [Cohnella sp. CFH 77786]
MKDLTDQQLLNVWKAAKELELDEAFITLLETELKYRGIKH